jgi:acetolactate synthase-1/2/3 large subunit
LEILEEAMLDTAAKPTAKPATTTAEDTLKQQTRDANVVSGGHLVARALKSKGVDMIFTLCGGHIIDIYDGCVDEGICIIDLRHEQVAMHAADVRRSRGHHVRREGAAPSRAFFDRGVDPC